jgi:hypothetical protein
MSHFHDGTEAKVGDRCRFKSSKYDPDAGTQVDTLREGLIFDVQPQRTTCDAQIAYPFPEKIQEADGAETRIVRLGITYVTLSECEKVA